MVSFEDLKVSLGTYIMKSRRVTHQDLLKWSSTNKVGNALLYLLIRELIREKRFKTSGEYVIGVLRIGNNDVKLTIPTYIEVSPSPKTAATTKRQARQRRGKSTNILEALSEEGSTKEEQGEAKVEGRTEVAIEKAEPKQEHELEGSKTHEEIGEAKGTEEGGTREVEKQGRIEGGGFIDYSSVTADNFLSILRNAIYDEVPQNKEEALKVALAMLMYLSRYWSVGELRLKLDIAKQFGGVNESILRIEDNVLRALRRVGLIEIVEPGVVNRVKDLPKDLVKVRLDTLFS
ncbi:MAG: hypothetical protein RXN86_02415 [Vulcanisaeta sp.]